MSAAHSRRDFFRVGARRVMGSVGQLLEARAAMAPAGPCLLRPPGALPEPEFRTACTGCDDCVAACPKMAIRKAGPESGLGAGTPIIVPDEQACHWCEDFPCITACTTGALVKTNGAPAALGTAVVDEAACYMWQGQPCDYCLLRCPEKGIAIRADEQSRPVIDAATCVGCGICMDRCPPDAITIRAREPLPSRAFGFSRA